MDPLDLNNINTQDFSNETVCWDECIANQTFVITGRNDDHLILDWDIFEATMVDFSNIIPGYTGRARYQLPDVINRDFAYMDDNNIDNTFVEYLKLVIFTFGKKKKKIK